MATWLDDIVRAMENRGGAARLSELYEELRLLRPDLAETGRDLGYWKATVRNAIETLVGFPYVSRQSRERRFLLCRGH